MARGRRVKGEPAGDSKAEEEVLKDAAEETTAAAAPADAEASSAKEGDSKRKAESDAEDEEAAKRAKISDAALIAEALAGDAADKNAELVPAAKEGQSFFTDNDVLSGRGGGTNVHPGNRVFREAINAHRRAYLKARKNDKPAISRNIVRQIRATGGKFLKKDEKSGLWFEVGDDAAREKTSQALRQRAPEMRKLLFDTEREEARLAAQEQLRQQRMFMGMPGEGGAASPPGLPPMPPMPPQGMPFPPFPFPPPPPGTKLPPLPPPNSEQYRQMFSFMPAGFPGFPPMMPPPGTPGDTKPAAKEEESPAPSNSANV